MGHKTHPLSMRLGYTKDWISLWYAKKQDFSKYLHEDLLIRKTIKKSFNQAAISKVVIERSSGRVRIVLHTARPGIIIGRRGADIDRLRDEIQTLTQKEISIDVKEVKNPGIDAQLVSENVAIQLERRISFRRAMKKAVQMAMQSGAQGIKVRCSGRLGGAEMCRTEAYKEGKIPLQTFKADLDYGFTEAKTVYGQIGVKVWVYKGDAQILGQKAKERVTAEKSKV